ncbi:excalibur calcium-binding domain-containing protein [Psychromonas sp. PT13]|uniref:excalibur calcium-binding domain-containing protein n=1 Tax=Psychromonas sp. PT13 TaxID=3439547 RepID=UPI003EB9393F
MKTLLIWIVVAVAGWHIYKKVTVPVITNADLELLNPPVNTIDDSVDTYASYSCDGREYCSQMTSCEEATFFIQNCPNTKMDGNHDGVPCERQFCH